MAFLGQAIRVYIYYMNHGYLVYSAYIQPITSAFGRLQHMPQAEGEGHMHCKRPLASF